MVIAAANIEAVVSASRPQPIASNSRSTEPSSAIATPTPIEAAWAAWAGSASVGAAPRNVDGAADRYIACGQQIDRGVERVAIEPQRRPPGQTGRAHA